NGVAGTGYRRWLAGKELETEQIDFGGGVMRRSTNLYEQESGVNWIAGATPTALDQPENNPRLVKVTSQLLDGGNKTSTVDYTYDEFNNVLTEELKGFDGQIIRRVERTYLRNLNGIDYAGLNRQIAPANNPNLFDTHLKSLILSESIKNKFNSIESTSTYEYDNYSNDGLHAALDPASLPANLHDPLFQGTQRIQRGNVTSITRGASTPEASTIYSQYDVLGNVTAIVGPLANQKTETEYSEASQFTFPTQTKQFVSGGVSGNRVLISNRTYDFDTGLVITSSGFNGDTTTFQYNDLLDRLTREIRPTGFGETTYAYSPPGEYPNAVTVESTLDAGRNLTSLSKFDGFLRTIEQRRTDHEGEVVSTTEYDAGGRVEKVTNPFRDGQSLTTDGYTTTTYDALDRVKTVNTFAQDGTSTGTVTTEYETNLVTVTDQAGKRRKSETDAAGRLVNVFEPDPQNNLNIVTNYEYDARSNLRQVNQGEQTRLFNYDSLSRLLSATSPESGDSNGNGATFYTYDKASNLIERRDPRNLITSYTYDSLNRLATKSYSDGTPPVSYFYDAAPNSLPTGTTSPSGFSFQNTLGRATAIASPTTGNNTPTGLFHSYDIGGRITNSSQLLDGQHYTTASQYNAASLPIGHTYPSGRTISHTFNIAGQIQAVESNGGLISQDNLYTPAGAIRYQQLGNGLYHEMNYNSRLQPTAISLRSGNSGQLWKLDYNYSQYDFNSINSSTSSPTISSNQAQNNSNIGSIRLTPGIADTTSPIDQFFVYDELNRLKLAKEFVSNPPPLISFFSPLEIGIGTSVTAQIFGINLANVNNANFSPSQGITFNIISVTSDLVTLQVTVAENATLGERFVSLLSPDGESNSAPFTITENFNCFPNYSFVSSTDNFSYIDADAGTDGDWASFGVGTFDTVTTATDTGSIDFDVDLTDPNLSDETTLDVNWFLAAGVVPNSSGEATLRAFVAGNLVATKTFSFSVDNAGNITGNGQPNVSFINSLSDGPIRQSLAGLLGSTIRVRVEIDATVNGLNTGIGGGLGNPAFGGFGVLGFTCSRFLPKAPKPKVLLTQPTPLAASSSWSQEYSYDRYGNRRAVIGTNAQNLSISTSKNRITDPGYDYDLAGNLIADPSGKLYEYDGENRLVKVAQGNPSNVIAEYFYDGNGWRVKKIANGVTTRFIYDQGGRLLAEYEGEPVPSLDAPTKENIYGASGMLATVEADKINYHTPDHLGSPRILTDGGGQVISRRDFFPFGDQIIDSVGNRSSVFGYSTTDSIRQKFTSYERDDETGLDYAKARYYANANGRFLSPDDFRNAAKLIEPQNWNLYTYVNNNPLIYIDPSGETIENSSDSSVALSKGQLEDIQKDLQQKSGLKSLIFVNGKLTYDKNETANGGSKTFRQQIIGAINDSKNAYVLNKASNDQSVSFTNISPAEKSPPGTQVYNIKIDFADYANAKNYSDSDAYKAFSLGLGLVHEINHRSTYDSLGIRIFGYRPDIGTATISKGVIDFVNDINSELGLIQRAPGEHNAIDFNKANPLIKNDPIRQDTLQIRFIDGAGKDKFVRFKRETKR
ncbi:MAG: RHS repeat-associated core domain-containing protein, partial [Blastocatellia bacterium]|nr:RHS repeat-associated core domain-containing protein [Blastocatellia bacterium]